MKNTQKTNTFNIHNVHVSEYKGKQSLKMTSQYIFDTGEKEQYWRTGIAPKVYHQQGYVTDKQGGRWSQYWSVKSR